MRAELSTHKLTLSFIALWIAGFLALVFLLGAHRSETRLQAEVVIVLTIVVAAAMFQLGGTALVGAGILGRHHRREFNIYLGLGSLALLLAAVLTLTTNDSMGRIALTVAPFPLLFGIAEMRIARGLSHHPRQANALRITGAAEVACSIALLASFHFSEANALRVITVTALATLFQLIPFVMFGPRDYRPLPRT